MGVSEKYCSKIQHPAPANVYTKYGMKLLLVRPNSAIERTPPPLGLLAIAAWLQRENPDVEIRIIDGRLFDWSISDFTAKIVSFAPDVVGITAMHADAEEAHAIAALVKHLNHDTFTILGGPYPTSDHAAAMRDGHVDYAVVGEGEKPLSELMRALADGNPSKHIKGIVSRNHLPEFPVKANYIEDLENLPLPAWDLINLDDYFYSKRITMENPMQVCARAVSIISSRGCPHRCIYCHDVFGKKFRPRSAQSIVGEIEFMIETYRIGEIEFIDDTFNMDMKRAKEFFSLMLERNLIIPISFSNGIRIDKVDEELLDLMKKAGVYRISYGIESASTRIQKIIRKNLDLAIVRDIVSETVKRGIITGGFFIFGFPGETEAEIKETIDFAVGLPLHTAVFSIATPFPGTEFHNIAMETMGQSSVKFTTMGKPSLNVSAVSDKTLVRLKAGAYRRFYFHPSRIWRIWRDTPSRRRLMTNFFEVLNVAFFGKELYGRGVK